MTQTKSIEELNRELGDQVFEDAKHHPEKYGGKYIGIANGRVVIAADSLNEIVDRLREVEPVPMRCFIVDMSRDPDKVYHV